MKKNAFSLIELILAIFILTVAVFGSFALIQQTISFASINKTKLTAYYLAQEGIENVRNSRDNNWLQGGSWLDWLNGLSESIEPVSVGNLTFNRETSFRPTDDKLKVTVKISWQERNREHSVEVITYLYNWYEQ